MTAGRTAPLNRSPVRRGPPPCGRRTDDPTMIPPRIEPGPSRPAEASTDEQLAATIARRLNSEAAMQAARAACERLYDRHARPLAAFLAARAPRGELEDIHQRIWERVWHRIPGGFHGGNFRAWLYQIARHEIIDQVRRRRPEAIDHESGLADPRSLAPDDGLIERERMALLSRCLEHLEPDAAGLVRARLAGEGYPEICARLGMSPQRAHRLFHQVKAQLQNCIERSLP